MQNPSADHRLRPGWFLAALLLSGLLLRLTIAYKSVHYFDLNYYVDWSGGVTEDFFGAYERIRNLDYPPLFLFFLYFTGKLRALPWVAGFLPFDMLALKGWQMLFDLALAPLLYWVLRPRGAGVALGCAALWALNPAILFNSAFWGQTDSMMLFGLLAAFGLLLSSRPVWASVVMTLACLMKFQSLYFAPVFGLALLAMRLPLRRLLTCILSGAGVALAVFFPFLLRSGWTLPFHVYFGGYAQYPRASLHAFNLYGALGLNLAGMDAPVLGQITAGTLSAAMLVLACVMLLFWAGCATEQSVWLLGTLFMQTIFLFTARMHERYQIAAVLFLLLAAVWHRSGALFGGWLALTAVSFLNHFVVFERTLARGGTDGWLLHYDLVMQVGSWCNLALYVYLLAVMARISFAGGIIWPRGIANRLRKSPPASSG